MKKFHKAIAGATLLFLFAQSQACSPKMTTDSSEKQVANLESIDSLFSAPLITGASVSANYGTESPGRRLSLRHTSPDKIKTFAQGGANSLNVVPSIDDSALSRSSIVFAIDLFFWDSVLPSASDSIRVLETFVEKTSKLKIPLVLGNIPSLLPGRQPSRNELNPQISRVCKPEVNCFVFELNELHNQILDDGYLQIGDKRFTLSEIIPDGLHLSDSAAEHLADRIEQLFDTT